MTPRTDSDERLLNLLIATVQAQSEQIGAMSKQLASLEATVKHLEEQVRRDSRYVQANLETSTRVDERHAAEIESGVGARAGRAFLVSVFSVMVAFGSVLWNVVRGGQ